MTAPKTVASITLIRELQRSRNFCEELWDENLELRAETAEATAIASLVNSENKVLKDDLKDRNRIIAELGRKIKWMQRRLEDYDEMIARRTK